MRRGQSFVNADDTSKFPSIPVRVLPEGLLPAGESQDTPEVPHWREALHMRVPRLRKGLQQRFRPGQAPEQDSLQRGNRVREGGISDSFRGSNRSIIGVSRRAAFP